MKTILLAFCMTIVAMNTYSQTVENPITISGKKFYQNGEKLKYSELKTRLSENAMSAPEYKLMQTNNAVATPLLLAGSICLLAGGISSLSSSLEEANALENGEIRQSSPKGLGLALAGLGCIVVSVPFSISAKKHLKNSVDLYNSSLKASSGSNTKSPALNLTFGANSIGVKLSF